MDSDINFKNFPISGKDKKAINVELWHPNKHLNNSNAIAELKKSKPGYRFATLPELLALGAAYPDLQRRFIIAALGSIWRRAADRYYFACLGRIGTGRSLVLDYLDYGFDDDWRFAVVREHTSV